MAGALLAGCLLVARLGWFQLQLHDDLQYDYLVGGGGSLLDTTRGAVYTADGVLLARDVAVFDLSIRYQCIEDDPEVAPDQWTEARRKRAEKREKRRLRGKKPEEAAERPDWKTQAGALTGLPVAELKARADEVLRKVELTWQQVNERTHGRIKHLRLVEQEGFHPIAENISREVALLVQAHPERFRDVAVTTRSQRVYRNGTLAPHVVGRRARISPQNWRRIRQRRQSWDASMPVSSIGRRYLPDDGLGVSGVERSCERLLRGRRGYRERQVLFHTLRLERRSVSSPPEPGCDVYLTLRSDFQQAANNALQWATTQPNLAFRKGALVVMDVRTGAILAAATWPSYNLETFDEDYERLLAADEGRPVQERGTPLLFRPTQAALPTGSVYKVITAIAALASGKITPHTAFTCSQSQVFRGRRFHCTGSHGVVELLAAIERSCNVYFYNVAVRCSARDLAEWGHKFGMGVPTGVDIAERSGQVLEPRSLFERLNLAIGQGTMLCTPLQVTRACAAIANGGVLVQPHFLDRAVDADGGITERCRPEGVRIDLAPETLRVVREGMRRVVHAKKGTGRHANLKPFNAAGKTGTAELGAGRPNHCWFAGFAPFDNPKIAFAVVSEWNPGHGGSHAAPIVAKALADIWPQVEQMP